ncbi:MAG: hypothetical protein J6U40_11355 [Kiritimatiellae bacterium]|nr:hypothetical protein [Kiritimatiellia bacterium]MBP5319377.1 hypothetical protein [Kiritimatiellia bacterium]
MMMGIVMAACVVAFTGCKKEETLADKTAAAAEKTEKTVKDAAKEVEKAAKDVAKDIEKAAQDGAKATEKAAEDLKKKVDGALNK